MMTLDAPTTRYQSKSENYLKKKLFSSAGNSNTKKSMAATTVRRKLTLPVNIYKPPIKGNGCGNVGDLNNAKASKLSGNYTLD